MFRKAALVLAVLLAGCDSRDDRSERELASLRDSQSNLLRQINNLEGKISELEAESDSARILKRSDSGYSVVKTDFGAITIQMKSVTADGAGSRVRLQIGNPTTATITKLMLFGHWGAVNKDGEPDGETHSLMQPTITRHLPAGTWSDASFLIEGAKPSDLGYLRITSALIPSISLNQAPAD